MTNKGNHTGMTRKRNGEIIMNRNSILIGGAAAGILAIVCALALVNTLKKSEKKK
jgi:hypothetical protein